MTRVPGPSATGAPARPAEGDGPPQEEAGIAVVRWLAGHHQRPFSAAAVLGGLPQGFDGTDPALMARALAEVGLASRLVLRRVTTLDPAVLPCVLFQKKGGPLILTGIDRRAGVCRVIDPAEGPLEREVRRRNLNRRVRREALLAAPEGDPAESRLSPEARAAGRRPAHWFWGAVRANWGGWVQVILAALAINLLMLALPLFVMNVYDRVIPNLAFVTLWTLALGVAIAIGLDLLMRAVRAHVLERISRRVDTQVASTLFRQAMALPILNRPGGAAGIASHIRDFDAVREFFASASFVSLIDLMFIGVFLGMLWLIVGDLALVPLVAVPVVLILAFLAQLPLGRAAAKAQQMSGKRHVVLVETLLGIETVKSLNAEPAMQREWERAVAASSRVNGQSRFWSSLAANGAGLVTQAVSVAIIVWGVFLVAEGAITVGALIAANLLAGRVLSPLGTIAQTIFRAQYAAKAMGALSRFMALEPERAGAVKSGLRVREARVSVEGVSFTYPDAPKPALDGLALTIAPGEAVALLGRVGSGKTTLGRLLAGLLVAEKGQILIDGHAIGQYDPAELRAGIGYLPQDSELFTGTIRENLILGRPHAKPAEIERALYLSGMDAAVAAMPDGLETFVGEKGSRLSGGQRQGLALARLILRAPRLLFLDEPTSAMDQEMEARVAARLDALTADGTGLVLCTHRQSLANRAARFVVIDGGRKILDGPKDEVLEQLRRQALARSAPVQTQGAG